MDPSTSTRFRHNLTLFDEIYRSIDQQSQPPTLCSQSTTRKKQTKFVEHDPVKLTSRYVNDHEHRACLYHKFMQNNVCEKPVIGRSYKPITKTKHDGKFIIKQEKDDGKLFVNTKAKALKMYNHLKKMKQPISPGGRLTTLFNSLFTTGNNKQPNSAACLGDTTSSRTKFSKEINKSVRFYSVSVNVDEETDSNTNRFSESLSDKNVEMKISEQENTRVSNIEDEHESKDEESDSSSDLFELKSLSPCRYQEELPIYATTNLHANRAIANSNLM